MNLSDHGNLKL
jgi:hypothetical protein